MTGASGGLGKEITLYFSKNNWNVIATMICINEATVFKDIPNIKCYELNVTSSESIEKATISILKDYKSIDVIINNAGVGYRSFVELSEDEKIDCITNVNWLGVVKVCRAFIPHFRQQQNGQFINITSIAGLVNLPLGSFYHPTKQAVESFSECMAYELSDFNISVATVQFGNIPSNFQKNISKCEKSTIESYNNMMQSIDGIMSRKTCDNYDLSTSILEKLFKIAENPTKGFKKYSIGFDANLMKYLRKFLGYRLFDRLIRRYVLSK
ncbi:SDR family NAD(P)-dependent oxidoreductase [Flavobacterium sp. SUN052]|uniref:SDR family NAD(P)-dependent oxidoreductase n=1 Tax=Flavobacterium sp. SUN052 TaxID=3002441 RepID=UPI00237E3220|nr:SDR family NAD(P)-dependent oxidoreductase [Flavobacterium sp. SUN052]MEC4005894.1 SDR family NAD(P)-dependent oxidoreductase [Flavobacterium sp. SUN052]